MRIVHGAWIAALAVIACASAPGVAEPPAAAALDARPTRKAPAQFSTVLPRGRDVLERASREYRALTALSDTACYVLRVPAAPEHAESQEFGFGPGAASWIRMPGQYVMQTFGERGGEKLALVEEGRIEPHIEASLGSGLQAALDSAFGGQGPPLAPAPLALRRALTLEQRLDAFRLRMLGPLRISDHRRVQRPDRSKEDVVTLEAGNGRVIARFDEVDGLLREFDAAFVPAPGADTIRATARFSPHPNQSPPLLAADLPQRGRRVTRLAELGGDSVPAPQALHPDSAFTSLDGKSIRIGDLVPAAGGYAVLEFWATWCAPCRGALPQVAQFARWARDSAVSVRVMYVNTQEDFRDPAARAERITRYLASIGAVGDNLVDERGSIHRILGGGLPLTVVLAKDGRIVETHAGYRPDLLDRLKHRARLLGTPRPAK